MIITIGITSSSNNSGITITNGNITIVDTILIIVINISSLQWRHYDITEIDISIYT